MIELYDEGIMTKFEKEGHSFLVRIWEENREKPDQLSVWRGWVFHVQSEQKQYFQTTDEIMKIINYYLEQNVTLESASEPDREEN